MFRIRQMEHINASKSEGVFNWERYGWWLDRPPR